MKTSLQLASIFSRFFAVGIGLIQTTIIFKLLSVSDYGIVKLVVSIAATVGVYQNLGLSSGSTREISAADSIKEVFKVFIGSTLVRYVLTVPLVLVLFFTSDYLANDYYKIPEIETPLKIFALILFIQAFQSVLNSVIQGLKKFKFLFYFQSAIAVVSLIIFVPFLYEFNYLGYFYANLVFNLISTLVLFFYTLKLFKVEANGKFGNSKKIEWPTLAETKKIFAAVFSIGVFVYIVKIIYTQWQNLGPLILGGKVSTELLGIFAFAIVVSSKITTISDAVTDVTLPEMTESFKKNARNFAEIFNKANSKAYFFILVSSILLILLKRDIFYVVDFIFSFLGKDMISDKYSSAFDLMDPLVLAFWGYAHMNLLKSGLAIPVKKLKMVVVSYVIMFIVTLGCYMVFQMEPLFSFALSMGLGGLAGYLSLLYLISKQINFYPITRIDILFTLVSLVLLGIYYAGINKYLVAGVFGVVSIYVFDQLHNRYVSAKLKNILQI